MTKWQYLRFCAGRSFRGSNAIAQTVALACTVIGGGIAYWNPSLAGSMNMLFWLLPLAVFIGLFVFQWTFAPYQLAIESSVVIAAYKTSIATEREASRDRTARHQDRLDELVAENERLRASIAKLEEATARVGHVRAALLKHADEAPSGDAYTPEQGTAWLFAADEMIQETVAQATANRFSRGPSSPKYADHRICVASLRALASNLRNEDLRLR